MAILININLPVADFPECYVLSYLIPCSSFASSMPMCSLLLSGPERAWCLPVLGCSLYKGCALFRPAQLHWWSCTHFKGGHWVALKKWGEVGRQLWASEDSVDDPLAKW